VKFKTISGCLSEKFGFKVSFDGTVANMEKRLLNSLQIL